MFHLTTKLITSLLQCGAAANEFLRSKIEEGANAVPKVELAGFLGYERHSSAGWHTGNSRNLRWMCRATATASLNHRYCRCENSASIRL